MDLLVMGNMDLLTSLERVSDALAGHVTWCQTLIMLLTMHENLIMNKIEKEHRLAKGVQRKYLEATYQ